MRSAARTRVGIGRNTSCLIGKYGLDFVSRTTCFVCTCIYSTIVFLVEVSSRKYLDAAVSWLSAIGEVNADRLLNLKLYGWTTRTFGHRTVREWEAILLHLKEGRMKLCSPRPCLRTGSSRCLLTAWRAL